MFTRSESSERSPIDYEFDFRFQIVALFPFLRSERYALVFVFNAVSNLVVFFIDWFLGLETDENMLLIGKTIANFTKERYTAVLSKKI